MTNGDFINGIHSDKKLEHIVRGNGFIHKLTLRTYSSLSNMKKCYYLIFRISIMHIQCFGIVSQNPDYVNTYCNIFKKLFHFAYRKWILNNQSL